MPCAGSFPFQTNSRLPFFPRLWGATIRQQGIGHRPGCWDQEEHICLLEDVQERRCMLLPGWCHHPCFGAMASPPNPTVGRSTTGAQAWPMKGARREEREYGAGE